MQIAMVGLGRMGANMVRRLKQAGHDCVVYDLDPAAVAALEAEGAVGASSYPDLIAKLAPPRAVWLMLPAAITTRVAREIAAQLQPGDAIIDGGNSQYRDAVDLQAEFAASGIGFVDVGTSGGVWGLERGYCLMIGGPAETVQRLDPIFAALSPGGSSAQGSPAERGYLHCGPSGSGHFTKMIHNGIEYGMMAAYAEGMNILKAANAGSETRTIDAETAPLHDPQYYRFDLDIAQIAEVWRHGSVVSPWLLDLTAEALKADPKLHAYEGRVSDSGEGRWTLSAAIDTGVPAPVLSSAVYGRFTSRDNDLFANKILSAMRHAFGGHHEKPKEG